MSTPSRKAVRIASPTAGPSGTTAAGDVEAPFGEPGDDGGAAAVGVDAAGRTGGCDDDSGPHGSRFASRGRFCRLPLRTT